MSGAEPSGPASSRSRAPIASGVACSRAVTAARTRCRGAVSRSPRARSRSASGAVPEVATSCPCPTRRAYSPGTVHPGAPGSLVGNVRPDPGTGAAPVSSPSPTLFGRGSWPEAQRIAAVLPKEAVGGSLLLVGAAIPLVWANSPWSEAYASLRDTRVGPASLHLDLTLGAWAADGLLAIFFFVAGLELKREFVAGDLREPRRAVLPVAAAVGGMAAPALLFVLFNLGGAEGALRGWAIPSATDIAFALAVLAVIST